MKVQNGTKVFCHDLSEERHGQLGIVAGTEEYAYVKVTWMDGITTRILAKSAMPANLLLELAQRVNGLESKVGMLLDPDNSNPDPTEVLSAILMQAQCLQDRLEEEPEAKAFLLRRRLANSLEHLAVLIRRGEVPNTFEAVTEWEFETQGGEAEEEEEEEEEEEASEDGSEE